MDDARLSQLERKIGHRFKQRALLLAALTHPSFRHESAPDEEDNQRLEFLGDAVLGMLAAHHLYLSNPAMPEGALTHARSRITNRGALADLGRQWDLGFFLRLGRGEDLSGGRERDSNLTDATEALMGAVYLDGGLRAASRFFERHWFPRLNHDTDSGEDKLENPKGYLQEYCQRVWKISPVYRITQQVGPPHARQYTAQVHIQDRVYGEGSGSNKRTAESRAAEKTIQQLGLVP